ncbi:MAG: TetR/AcrR family transcriptional regulator [Candidatus Xenobia bacterium]
MKATLELIGEVGVHGFSLREVARRADVTHAAPYRHFASKEELIAAICEEGFGLMQESMSSAIASADPDPLERFQAAGTGYLRFALTYPSHCRLMFGGNSVDRKNYPALQKASRSAFDMVRELVKACQVAGYFRAQSSVELALASWALGHGLASLYLEGQLGTISDQLGDLETMGHIVGNVLQQGLLEKHDRRQVARLPRSS